MFVLDPAFKATSIFVTDLALSQARLQADARWPWIVLVPRAPGLREIEDLPAQDRAPLMEEAIAAGAAVRAVGEALGRPVQKLNVGALGNVTPQLHVHVIGRFTDDPAWPRPIWGVQKPLAFDSDEAEVEVIQWRERLA